MFSGIRSAFTRVLGRGGAETTAVNSKNAMLPPDKRVALAAKVRYYLTTNPPQAPSSSSNAGSSSTTPEPLDNDTLRQMIFDAVYRCQNKGGCYDNSAICVFPQCVCMRPMTKGAELRAQRATIEDTTLVDELKNPALVAARKFALDEHLEKAIEQLSTVTENNNAFFAARVWKAVLLVNLGNDKEAVQLLLETIKLAIAKGETSKVLTLVDSAVCWATLHDMMQYTTAQTLAQSIENSLLPKVIRDLTTP
eukprot:PhF_6_TR28150/c0_g1_i2/m.41697